MPRKPHSSPSAARIRSVCAAGTSCGVAESDPRARHAAGGERPQRVRQLIAAVHQVVPGREPHRDAVADGVRDAEQIAGGEAERQQRQPAAGTTALPRAMP